MDEKDEIEKAGRGTDDVVGHLTVGELVVPVLIFQRKNNRQVFEQMFSEQNVDINEFIVGNPANKVNPETGYPEFFFKSVFKAVGKIFGGVAKAIGLGPPKMPTMVPPKPVEMPRAATIDQTTVDRERSDMMRRRRGRAATVLAGGSGVVGSSSVATKALLGQ